jgi:hypothetical protein
VILKPGDRVMITSPKGRKIRGYALIASASRDSIIFSAPVTFKVKRGDKIFASSAYSIFNLPYFCVDKSMVGLPGLERYNAAILS